ncbi:MAG: type IV secretion system DNA-binding domain-containing protein [Bifidobacteriaceae bacterium]|jgi:hypothetical protein|nr:type IV secretion system DNA-binding domain-containing protein [Bifidobacteriaceae bacterium]
MDLSRTQALPQQEHAQTRAGVRQRAFKGRGLVPTSDPAKASRWAVTNLINTVKHWPADALVGIVLRRQKKGVEMTGWVNDAAPDDWFADLAYVLRPIAAIGRLGQVRPPAGPVMEVVPARPDSSNQLPQFLDEDRDRHKGGFGRDALPAHINDPMWDFLALMNTWPGAAMTILVSPAPEAEQALAASSWQAAFAQGQRAESQAYLGTPIRARVLLHGHGDAVPARVAAEMMIMSRRIEVHPLGAMDRRELREPNVDCLKGCAMPEGAVSSILHLPAAGLNRPVPGMKVLPPRPRRAPYDPPPKPNPAYEAGRCFTPEGKTRPVWLSQGDLCRHLELVGATGTGKSTFARGLLGSIIEDGCGVLLLDPHGTLCKDLMGDTRDSGRLVYVDYSDPERVAPFNLLHAGTEEEFEARLQSFMNIIVDRDSEEYTGPRWRRCFGVIARGCWALFGNRTSLVMIFSILGSQDLCRALAAAIAATHPHLAEQITVELGNVSPRDGSELWSWLVCKGEEVLGSHALTRVLGTGAHSLDLAAAVDQSRAVLVNLGLPVLGERSAQLVGCMILAELRQVMLARRDRSRPFFAFLDEAHLFQYGALPSLLDEARKFKIGMTVCHQRPDQLRFQVKDALSANAGSYVQLRTGNLDDARRASAVLRGWPVDDLVRMRDLTGAAVISRDGVPSEPFSIEFDFFKRHARELAEIGERAAREQRVRQASNELLVKPFEGLIPVTRDTIADQIRTAKAISAAKRQGENHD